MWIKTQEGEYLNLARARSIYVEEQAGSARLMVRFLSAESDVDSTGAVEPAHLLAIYELRYDAVYKVVLEELLRGTAHFIDLTGAPDKIEQRFWHSTRHGAGGKGHELE